MVCAPVRSIMPSLKLGDYLSVQAHKPCSISHIYNRILTDKILTRSWYGKWQSVCKEYPYARPRPPPAPPPSSRNSIPGPDVIKHFSCSTKLSMKYFLPINIKMPTIVGNLTFMSRKNSILGLPEPEKCRISWYFHTYEHSKFYAQLSWACKKFYNLGTRS